MTGAAAHTAILCEEEVVRLDREALTLLVACVPVEELTILEYWPASWRRIHPYRRVVTMDMIPDLLGGSR